MSNPNDTVIPEGYKRCSKGDNCVHTDGQILPANGEYFGKSGNKLNSQCRECAKAWQVNYRQSAKGKEHSQTYHQSPEVKTRKKARKQTPEYKEQQRGYNQRPEVKAKHKALAQTLEYKTKEKARHTPEWKARRKIYEDARKKSPEGRAVIRAWNQSPKRKEYQKRYWQIPEHKAANKLRNQSPEGKAYSKEYQKRPQRRDYIKCRSKTSEGRATARICWQRRRARQLALPAVFKVTDWQRAKDYFAVNGVHCCAVCERPVGLWHTLAMDHWIPVANGGAYTPDNIIPLCHGVGGCNNEKSDRNAHEWLVDKYGPRKAAKIEKRIQAYFYWVSEQDKERA